MRTVVKRKKAKVEVAEGSEGWSILRAMHSGAVFETEILSVCIDQVNQSCIDHLYSEAPGVVPWDIVTELNILVNKDLVMEHNDGRFTLTKKGAKTAKALFEV